MPGPISRYLAADHDRLDALLARATAGPEGIDDEAYTAFRAGLLRHIGLEEKILLTAAKERRGGEPLDVARRLREDHGKLAALLVRTPTREIVAQIRGILGPHNALEEAEDGVYAVCDELLADEAEALVDRMRAVEPPPLAPYYDGPKWTEMQRERNERKDE